jgi:membrane carboxypeptidase/penicillin-binding protein
LWRRKIPGSGNIPALISNPFSGRLSKISRLVTITQGGSTITQQVTKSFLLTPERTYERKLKEAILAYRIEKKFSKDEILFLYMNQIYLGHGALRGGIGCRKLFRQACKGFKPG